MPRYRIITLLILCSLLFTGCWDQKLFEQMGLVLAKSIEESSDGKLLTAYTYPVIGGKEKDTSDFMAESVTTLREGRQLGRLRSPKFIEVGKVQELLISEDLAKKGIHDLLEVYQRDPTSPAVAYVVIVEGSPYELLEKGIQFKDKPRIGLYLYQLLENNSKRSIIPNTKVFDFDIDFFAPGLDPITPLIQLGTADVAIRGCALFSEDKMVGKLDNNQTIMLLGMMGETKNTDFSLSDPQLKTENPDKYGVAIVLQKPKRKIDISFDNENKLNISISLKYKCALDEYKWNKTDDAKEQQKIEKIISEQMQKLCTDVIKKLQEVNSDPIGLGNIVRAKYNQYWKSVDWKEAYKNATITVNVKADIYQEGIIK